MEDGTQRGGPPPRRVDGKVYSAPLGTSPDDLSRWAELGYLAEDGTVTPDQLEGWGHLAFDGEVSMTVAVSPQMISVLHGIPLAEAYPPPRPRCVAFGGGHHPIRYARRRPRGYWG